MMSCELINLSELDKVKFPELHLRHTVIVKYKGYSMIAQTMIPGNQFQEQEKKKAIRYDESDTQILQNLCKVLKLSDKMLFKNSEGEIQRSICNP